MKGLRNLAKVMIDQSLELVQEIDLRRDVGGELSWSPFPGQICGWDKLGSG
ncbi:hypothetical protein [Azospirillum endophyticum]